MTPIFLRIKQEFPKTYHEIIKYISSAYMEDGDPYTVEIEDDGYVLAVYYKSSQSGEEEKIAILERDLYEMLDSLGIKISVFTINHEDRKGLFTYSIDGFNAKCMEIAFEERHKIEYVAFIEAFKIIELTINN